jgi:manganese/zinc/iron transport system permease protein
MLIVPAATAYLFTDRLWLMLLLAVGFGVLSAVVGYGFSRLFDSSVAGAMALMTGVFFTGAWLFAPSQGVVAQLFRRARLAVQFAGDLLVAHLADASEPELPTSGLARHFRWRDGFAQRVLANLRERALVEVNGSGTLHLTEAGRRLAGEFHRPAGR